MYLHWEVKQVAVSQSEVSLYILAVHHKASLDGV